MISIKIKPLSLNKAYRGRRYATPELKAHKDYLALTLPKMTIPKGKLRIDYVFGVSSKGADGDNLVKIFQDSLASKYGFNDNKVYEWSGKKVDVKKGQEYVEFEIKSATE